MSMYIGEALVGEGNEIAHIDLLIGSKDGPVGTAFANALANQSAGPSSSSAASSFTGTRKMIRRFTNTTTKPPRWRSSAR
jgi:5,6,7,8-tetrahydromethanopterin hydro-lyase